MIRELTVDEVVLAAEVAPFFFEEGKLPMEYSSEAFTSNWQMLIRSGSGHIYGLFIDSCFVGGLGLIVSRDINNDEVVANEAFWFVHKAHRGQGVKLLLTAQKAAKELSCKRLTMVHLHNHAGDQLSSIYSRLGFSPIETHYIKSL